MKKIVKYDHADFKPEDLLKIKNDKKIYAVFSTFGEREADLVIEKIGVLKQLPAGLVDKIIINHRRAGDNFDRTESGIISAFSDVDIMVSNTAAVPDMKNEKGKGGDMRRTIYRINREYLNGLSADNAVVVFLDADVLPEYFGAHFATGLAGAVLNGADYAKGGFWREMGRVKKYVAQPLFSAVSHPSLKLLSEFSYPLSGECAGTLSFFNSVSFWQMYGVETGVLIDAVSGDYKLADVNLGLYDHEHHNDINIQKMSFGIIRTYLRSLIDYGIITLNNGASLSDVFAAEYINSDGERVKLEENLTEIKYRPLSEIL
ncbi:MAG: hypothetical protein CVV49_15375 [Spirochaetae bacterium HGW-Spirochaetae-5]|nr:MAG: hypothetical protein CVV49_15375 [Spirochaetae bacterium HGW-Spirochaetae-5]